MVIALGFLSGPLGADAAAAPAFVLGLLGGWVAFIVCLRSTAGTAPTPAADEEQERPVMDWGIRFLIFVLTAGFTGMIVNGLVGAETDSALSIGLLAGLAVVLAPALVRRAAPWALRNLLWAYLLLNFALAGLIVLVLHAGFGFDEPTGKAVFLGVWLAVFVLASVLWKPLSARVVPWLERYAGPAGVSATGRLLGDALANQRAVEALNDSYTYDVFISYRHASPDKEIAEQLHRELEAYRAPANLVEQGWPERVKRVFRDREELPVSSSLSDNIVKALRQSRFLIVVCSPRTPESRWVAKEIELFRELGGGDQIMALLIEGDPTESFPLPLRQVRRPVAGPDGTVQEVVEDAEPLAADIRGRDLADALRRLKTEKLRLLAPIFGCGYDDLKQRHREQFLRRWNLIGGSFFFALAALVLLLAYAG
jgi:hypothetical protein